MMRDNDEFSSKEDEQQQQQHERMMCLVEQGFTPSLAQNVIEAKSTQPLTIWIVDNSGSMNTPDGKRLLETTQANDIRVVSCTRWEELKETVMYHAQLSALLESPTKFVLLNKPNGPKPKEFSIFNGPQPQEFSIAERGSEWIQDDLQEFQRQFSKVYPSGVTPLTRHLQQIYESLQYLQEKIVLVIATDGRPTDRLGYTSHEIDLEFEFALKQVQSKAWVVIRLCTNDDDIIKYYQKIDDELELQIDILDDYLDEAKEVYTYNPWLTYSLCLQRCREMGMSYSCQHRWLDWLDERSLTKIEICQVLKILGVSSVSEKPQRWSLQDSSSSKAHQDSWITFCNKVQKNQQNLSKQHNELFEGGSSSNLLAFTPWNPIQSKPTLWIDCKKLQCHGYQSLSRSTIMIIVVALVAIVTAAKVGLS